MKRILGYVLLVAIFSGCGVVATSEEDFSEIELTPETGLCDPGVDNTTAACETGSD